MIDILQSLGLLPEPRRSTDRFFIHGQLYPAESLTSWSARLDALATSLPACAVLTDHFALGPFDEGALDAKAGGE
ncbi:hypothetical protein [Bradyrhizobium sp. CCBAU 45384]|uniref:hypothetical protein n=1 Tax=Bradyrhizobium sp. CCBAU 45384 TaxID=858428 RepID=UPI0023059DD1|nr:hypothetical protein [Bradyrhizobium sp. CCBAU 45384]